MLSKLSEQTSSKPQITESVEQLPTRSVVLPADNAGMVIEPRLSVIMPAYNEGQAIGQALDAVLQLAKSYQWEVIVVDDGSDDDTAEQVQKRLDDRYLKLVRHPYNRGYGAALKTGIRVARAELVAMMDSDGQHDPCDLLNLLRLAKEYDLIVGQRPGLVHSPFWRMPGKWFLSWLAKRLTRRKIADLNSGMRLFRSAAIRKYLHLCPDGFSFSTTSTLAMLNRGYAVAFTPITIRPRHQGVKSTVKLSTGFDTLVLIFRVASLFQPLRVFLPASGLFITVGILWGLPYILFQHGVSVGALLLILTGLLLFFFGLLTDQVAQLRLEKYE